MYSSHWSVTPSSHSFNNLYGVREGTVKNDYENGQHSCISKTTPKLNLEMLFK